MSGPPSLLDRLLKRAIPRPVEAHTPPPRALDDELWVLDRELLHFRCARLPARTTIIRLAAGGLVVISPPPLGDPRSDAATDALGPVAYVVVPNPFHYLFAQAFLDRCAGAKLMAAPGLVERVPELQFATGLGSEPPAAWSGELEYVVVGSPGGPCEAVCFHRPTKTLILTDFAFHIRRYARRWDRIFWRLVGMPAGFGPGRTSRRLLLTDRTAASVSLARILEWPIQRIVPAHGDIIEADAKSRLRTAFADYLGGPDGPAGA